MSNGQLFFDVFICHASEDKDGLVRPLAETLQHDHHLHVWYDEFSLKLGDSLRQSIDKGLARSRYGIVVLSPHFFSKNWPQKELNALVALENESGQKVILPIWHGLSKEDVARCSPLLADRYAVDSNRGLKVVVSCVLKVVRPAPSPLLVARDILVKYGLRPAVVTDDWWLDVAEASAETDVEGTFQEAMGWGRWGFSLPPMSKDPEARGVRLAWGAMQMLWQQAAGEQLISQMTEPGRVMDFIHSHAGLREDCHRFPVYLASYAPQLTIPGLGGEFEADFDNLLEESARRQAERRAIRSTAGTALPSEREPPLCDEFIALHHPSFGNYSPEAVACQFVQGELHGPPVMLFERVDYVVWLLSDQSLWMPERVRTFLTTGMKKSATWYWLGHLSPHEEEIGLRLHKHRGALLGALLKAKGVRSFEVTQACGEDTEGRFAETARLLDITQPASELAERFFEEGFIREWFAARRPRRRSTKKTKPAKRPPRPTA